MTSPFILVAPLDGWCLPLREVPDPVFADGMAGDGIAIDPTGGVLHAPCDGEVVPMKGAHHAITLRTSGGIDVLMHIGIDTVGLKGTGFDALVAAGARVTAGDALVRFDLDRIARGARSLVTPIVLASPGAIVRRSPGGPIKVGDFLLEIAPAIAAANDASAAAVASRRFTVPFEHGLHVRPAAQIAALLKPFRAEVSFESAGRKASARSTVAMMALGVRCGDVVEAAAAGDDALAAIEAVATLLAAAPDGASASIIEVSSAGVVPARIDAAIASRGVAIGAAVQWAEPEIAVEESGEGAAVEGGCLRRALDAVASHLERQQAKASGDHQSLLRAHIELLRDPCLIDDAEVSIARGSSAAFAWRHATHTAATLLAANADSRMRERVSDLRDIEGQVLRALAGEPLESDRDIPHGAIILADDLLPSQLIALDASRIGGICTARGGPTSHMSLLAAAMRIPTLVGAGAAILAIPQGTPVVLDAEHGWLDVDPLPAQLAAMQRAAAEREAEHASDMAAARRPSETRDGLRIVVNANLGAFAEARGALECGAEGCGLLRTEFLFLDRRDPPGEDEQAREYQRIAEALGGRPLAIRTLDLGGDKPIAYWPMPREDNPALGLRGLRATLSNPGLMRTQLRAILAVQPASARRILLPMITDVSDLRAALELIRECAAELRQPVPAVGAMIETPASALLAEQLAAEADFLSIGSNDLSQYTLAIDRGHPQLASRLDALHPAVLRLMARVAEAGHSHGKAVSVCGALGSDVDALPILIGLGVHEISATPAIVPRLKRTVRLLDAGECRELAARALEQASAAAVRELALFARSRARAHSAATFSGG